MVIPVSAIIATRDRARLLQRTLSDVARQSCHPTELIIVDSSTNDETKRFVESEVALPFKVVLIKTDRAGAATQREQGLAIATQPYIWFLDDDIVLEEACTERLWKGFRFSDNIGAVNAMITNQRYTTPGTVTRWMYRLMHGRKLSSYAGKIIGPAWNLLPEDEQGLPEYTVCEWLNTTCTMYKRDVLPDPVFPAFFTGYSLMEDVALSVSIAKSHTLLNARTARIFHDSQPGVHKDNARDLSRMELVNRYYIMTQILGRRGFSYVMKFGLLQSFGFITSLRNPTGRRNLLRSLGGKLSGVVFLISHSLK